MAGGAIYVPLASSPSRPPTAHHRRASSSSGVVNSRQWTSGRRLWWTLSAVALLSLALIAHRRSSEVGAGLQEESRGASDAAKADEWEVVERPTGGGEESSAHELGVGEEVEESVQEVGDEWSGIGAKEGEGGSSESSGADEVLEGATLDGGLESLDDEEDALDEDVGATTMPLVTSEQEEQQELEEPVPCSDTVKSTLASPSFWVIREPAPSSFIISPRSTHVRFPYDCLTHAVFAARLIRSSPPSTPGEARPETILALPRPQLLPHSADYTIIIPTDVVLPRASYKLDVRLEFGVLAGATEAQICGDETSCDPLVVADILGETVAYVGGVVEFEEGAKGRVDVGTTNIESSPPLCTTFGPFNGYWDHLTYHPTPVSTPCSLVDVGFPVPFVPTQPSRPVWLNFVGDSNTRNMFSLLAQSLGNGPYSNAVVKDSSDHNGTVATIALRSRTGDQEYGNEAVLPDIILTWSWWYQTAPPSTSSSPPSFDPPSQQAWDATVSSNREKLLFLANVTLADWASQLSLQRNLGRSSSALAKLATGLRPSRTYLSLGSHGEELTARGVDRSLDVLLAEEGGLGAELREAINLRLFTTTLVNPTFIPLDRFPHQDLVRNNPAIEAKNAVARGRAELGGEGRVIDVEAMVRGVTEGWMKEGKKGMDAVHFVERVYSEWVRVVWTELVGMDT